MVMFWSRSDWRASMRLAHSKGTPRRLATASNCSSLPSGSEPVSCRRRPTKVDLPWSTWPTMTIFNCSLGAVPGLLCMVRTNSRISHVAVTAQLLEGVFALLVLRAAGAFGSLGVPKFLDDLAHSAGGRF